jgi:hypothetical protein
VTLGDDQHPVQAFAPSTPHPALGVGVRPRCHQRSQDHPGAIALEDGVEASGELSISVVDHDPNVDTFVAQLPAQVASLLGRQPALKMLAIKPDSQRVPAPARSTPAPDPVVAGTGG